MELSVLVLYSLACFIFLPKDITDTLRKLVYNSNIAAPHTIKSNILA
jgi:hypothetical protein